MNKYSHVLEKLTTALKCLATHPGDARARVASAYLLCAHLRLEEFPEESRNDWEWIKREVTRRGPIEIDGKVWRGSVENTMKNVRKPTGVKIANKFWDLYWTLSENTRYR